MSSPLDEKQAPLWASKAPPGDDAPTPYATMPDVAEPPTPPLRSPMGYRILPLSAGAREVAGSLIPGDEVDRVYACFTKVLDTVARRASVEFAPEHVEDPPDPVKMDIAVRDGLVEMAKHGVRGGLSKLTWMSYALTADDYLLREHRPDMLAAAVLHRRLHQSDFYLSEFRRLQANEASKTWTVTVQSPDGKSVVQKPRVFPMWGLEVENGLNNHQKAKAWYRSRLRERRMIK